MSDEQTFIKQVVRSGLNQYGIPDEKIKEDDAFFIHLCNRVNQLANAGHSYGGAFEVAVAEGMGGGVNPNYDEMFKA